MEASQQVEAIERVGMFAKTDFDLGGFALECQKRYFAERGIEYDSDLAKAHLDYARSLLDYVRSLLDSAAYCNNSDYPGPDVCYHCFSKFFDVYQGARRRDIANLFNTDMLGLPVKNEKGFVGIAANCFLFVISFAKDNDIASIKKHMSQYPETQDLFHAIVKETYCVYNEKMGFHGMEANHHYGFNSYIHTIFKYQSAAISVMIKCGVKEETISLYCKKLAGSFSCFEKDKNLLSFKLITEFLLEYLRIESDNKEVFWRLFKTFLEGIDFKVNSKVNSHVDCSTRSYEKFLFNSEEACLEVKECAFIFYFLYHFRSKLSLLRSFSYNCAGTKDDMLICIFTELIVEYGLDVEVLDYRRRDLRKASAALSSEGKLV